MAGKVPLLMQYEEENNDIKNLIFNLIKHKYATKYKKYENKR